MKGKELKPFCWGTQEPCDDPDAQIEIPKLIGVEFTWKMNGKKCVWSTELEYPFDMDEEKKKLANTLFSVNCQVDRNIEEAFEKAMAAGGLTAGIY